MKVSIATLKSFLRKNEGRVLIKVTSDFDGMTDCVVQTGNKEFVPLERDNYNASSHLSPHTLGYKGVWFVGSSRDRIYEMEDTEHKGYTVNNSCGSFTLAVKK